MLRTLTNKFYKFIKLEIDTRRYLARPEMRGSNGVTCICEALMLTHVVPCLDKFRGTLPTVGSMQSLQDCVLTHTVCRSHLA